MKLPLSWIKDYVDISLPILELAQRMTMAGLEVEEISYVGLPMAQGPTGLHAKTFSETTVSGLEWEPDKIVVGAIYEVMPHPNADRLVLCRLDDGQREQIVLTGAPNLFEYKGKGPLPKPLKVAYAREGARIFDGHQPGQVITTLKRTKIRGVDSYSMACSEKELGISDEHEGIIILDDDAPVGKPLVDYMGDAVFDINVLPNIARDANVVGVAREIAALTGQTVKTPPRRQGMISEGPAVAGQVAIQIIDPQLNPRFVLGLIQNVNIGPSPYWMQRRLRLAGMRPINNIVDITNYVMLEVGQPLHAFDYDVLVRRAGGKSPTLITRTAHPGEHLTTLDGADRPVDNFTVLVCDTVGALSIAGVMGGVESEVSEKTRTILLEGAAWNFINIRKTVAAQHLQSEAAYRFSRGVHPALAEEGVRYALELMRLLSGGAVYQGLVDNYPLQPHDPRVEITPADVRRWLGIDVPVEEIARILRGLQFGVEVTGNTIRAQTPPHRLDIGTGITGVADLVEEVARIYGYDHIPDTRITDELPPQRSNPELEKEEKVRDVLVNLGLQEVYNYRLTSPEREARCLPPGTAPDDTPYVRLANPISGDRVVLRHSGLASLLEIAERNSRLRGRLGLFEIGPVFLGSEEGNLPDEIPMLVILLTGPRALPGWQPADDAPMDFFDMKGLVQSLLNELHVEDARYLPVQHPSFHPGKCARLLAGDRPVGTLGELHPLVRQRYDLPSTPMLAAEFNLNNLLEVTHVRYVTQSVSAFPPVLEDLAVIVDDDLPAEKVESVIRQAGGKTLTALWLFDVFRGEQVGTGKKSLAYSLTYQEPDRTLTDEDATRIRQRIIRRLDQELGAKIRS